MKVWVIDFIDGDRTVCGTAEKAYKELEVFIKDTYEGYDDESARNAVLETLKEEYNADQDMFGVENAGWAIAETVY